MREVRRTDGKWQFSSIKSKCLDINEKFLVGFRNCRKDKQVSVIVCENSINSILNRSLNCSFIKVDLIINIYKGWVSLFAGEQYFVNHHVLLLFDDLMIHTIIQVLILSLL